MKILNQNCKKSKDSTKMKEKELKEGVQKNVLVLTKNLLQLRKNMKTE